MKRWLFAPQFLISVLLITLAISFSVSGCKEDVGVPNTPNRCTFIVSGTSFNIPAGGASRTIEITAGSSCMWTAVSNVPWVEIVSGQSGSGNGTVTYEVAANAGASRTGSLTIAGQTVTVTQDKKGCIFSLNPSQISFDAEGGTGTVHVRTSSGCKWTARTSVDWIRIVSGSSGTGNGTIQYEVLNNTADLRLGAIVIADENFKIEQSGMIATYSIIGNTGEPKVEIRFAGKNAPDPVFTDEEGKFRQSGFSNGTYVVRPVSACFDFEPRTQTVLISNSSARNVDFHSSKNLKADAGGEYDVVYTEFTITFSGIRSVAANPIQTYIWDFGDGEVESCDCPTIQHQYSEELSPCPGDTCTRTLPVTLTIRDIYGCEDRDTTEIEITFGY